MLSAAQLSYCRPFRWQEEEKPCQSCTTDFIKMFDLSKAWTAPTFIHSSIAFHPSLTRERAAAWKQIPTKSSLSSAAFAHKAHLQPQLQKIKLGELIISIKTQQVAWQRWISWLPKYMLPPVRQTFSPFLSHTLSILLLTLRFWQSSLFLISFRRSTWIC